MVATIAISQLVYGPFADRFGRRPTLLFGVALYFAGSVSCVLTPDIGGLMIGRVAQAAGAGAGVMSLRLA